MESRELAIGGSWEFRPTIHTDSRGIFLEAFTSQRLHEATGRSLTVAQINASVSQQGVVRGIHTVVGPEGQAKYVTCVAGRVLDVIVDLRPESPTFCEWDSVLLDDEARTAVFLSEGLGHGFQVLSTTATIMYATSSPYDPRYELSINPFDPLLGISWVAPLVPKLSPRDESSPTVASTSLGMSSRR